MKFSAISSLKKQPAIKGFPVPMAKQMAQQGKPHRPPLKFPKPKKGGK